MCIRLGSWDKLIGSCTGNCQVLAPWEPDIYFLFPQACRDFLELAETHSRKWQRTLQYEREQRIRLEETIEQLAKQHNSLERACRGAPGLSSSTTGITNTTKGEQPPSQGCQDAVILMRGTWARQELLVLYCGMLPLL